MDKKFFIKDFFEKSEKIITDFYMEHREINMHSHEFWEISYVYEGRGVHHFDDGSTSPISEGEFIFISPGVSHCITSPLAENSAWVRVCNMLITEEYIDSLLAHVSDVRDLDEYALRNILFNREHFCIHLKDDSGTVYHLLMTAAHEHRHFSDGSADIIENTAESLLVYIIRLYEKTLKNETVATTKNDVIDDLIKYIHSNFGGNITLDFLAAYVHLSPEYLSRYFRKHTGVKLSDFITKTRMERAKYRLRTSEWTVSDISAYCGYRSVSNFQKAFKKAVGMTAGEYRERNRRYNFSSSLR